MNPILTIKIGAGEGNKTNFGEASSINIFNPISCLFNPTICFYFWSRVRQSFYVHWPGQYEMSCDFVNLVTRSKKKTVIGLSYCAGHGTTLQNRDESDYKLSSPRADPVLDSTIQVEPFITNRPYPSLATPNADRVRQQMQDICGVRASLYSCPVPQP